MGDIIIVTVLAMAVFFIVRGRLRRLHGGGCHGSCAGCPGGCGGCAGPAEKKKGDLRGEK